MVSRNEPTPDGQRSRQDLRVNQIRRPGTCGRGEGPGKQSALASGTTLLVEQREQRHLRKRSRRSTATEAAGARLARHRNISLCRAASPRQRGVRQAEGAVRKEG